MTCRSAACLSPSLCLFIDFSLDHEVSQWSHDDEYDSSDSTQKGYCGVMMSTSLSPCLCLCATQHRHSRWGPSYQIGKDVCLQD